MVKTKPSIRETLMRKLVQIKTIDRIDPIEKADSLETAVIGGWKAVIRKGEFTAGESILYFEVDSVLPNTVPEFQFLMARSEKTVVNEKNQNVTGHILKTVRLRGQISQGLILPLGFGLNENSSQDEVDEVFNELGVFKYEPVNSDPKLQVGVFPTGLARKTDSERVQNLTNEFLESLDPSEWIATEKVDGTSSTFIKIDGELRIAGRNWELNIAGDHLHARIARELDLAEIMPEGSVLQGEIFGEGIQKNPLKMDGVKFAIFSSSSLGPDEKFDKFVEDNSVPRRDFTLPKTIDEAVEQVYGMKSLLNPKAQSEGVVWWNVNNTEYEELGHRPNFKAINNKFLIS